MTFATLGLPRRAGRRMVIKPGAGALAILALGATAVGVSSVFDRSSAAAASKPPGTVTATRLPADKPPFSRSGTIVSSSRLGNRAFVNDKDGFALATLPIPGVTYPAATTNGGKQWRIDGPHFHVAAANAPNVVTQVGAAGPATYFAYGGPGGGNSACVTSDGGKHWWRAYLPGTPVAIVYSHVTSPAELVAFAEHGPGQFWVYVSSDGGHHWHYHNGSI